MSLKVPLDLYGRPERRGVSPSNQAMRTAAQGILAGFTGSATWYARSSLTGHQPVKC